MSSFVVRIGLYALLGGLAFRRFVRPSVCPSAHRPRSSHTDCEVAGCPRRPCYNIGTDFDADLLTDSGFGKDFVWWGGIL